MSNAKLARDEGRHADTRTYRGSDLDELLPKIRAELGPDAIVIRQREGLGGGVGGFFQKRCVEVVARRAAAGLDSYDGDVAGGASHAPYVPEPPSPAIAEIMRVASPFIEQLQAAQAVVAEPAVVSERAPAPEPAAETRPLTGAFGASAYTVTPGGAMVAVHPVVDEPVPAPALALVPDEHAEPEPAERTGAAAAHERTLVAAGIAAPLAAELIDATVSHRMPFAPRRSLKHVVRDALALAIPLAPPLPAGGHAVAFVGAGGSGKTLCATRLAAAYAAHSNLPVSVVDLTAPELPAPGDPAAAGTPRLTVIDTAAVSPGAAADVRRLAAQLRRHGRPAVHVAVPATLSASAVRTLLDGYAPLKPSAIVLTHLDEVGHAGPVIDEAISRGIAISYTSDSNAADGFGPADPVALASRVLA